MDRESKILIIELHDFMKPNCSKPFYSAIKKYPWKKIVQGENIILIKKFNKNN